MAKVNGKNVFIPFALPGEKLAIEITKSMRDYDCAKITRIIESSPERVQPFCPLYGICGGCNTQHISQKFQEDLRLGILKDAFEREGISLSKVEVISGGEKNYRSRIQLTDGGFNKRESNEVVEIKNCPVATEELNSYFESVPMTSRPRGRIHLFGDSRVTGETNLGNQVALAEFVEKTGPKITGGTKKKVKNKVKARFSGTAVSQINPCTVSLLGKSVSFDVKGFFQSNMQVLESSLKTMIDLSVGGKNLLDMYSGVGTFSVFLAPLFEKTYLVEHNRDALVFAEQNLAGIKHESYGLSGAKWVSQIAPKIISTEGEFDTIVIDPPRSGMEREVRDFLCAHKAKRILSVSCDAPTHARDAARLIKAGYRLSKLYLLDFYPQTAHIESLALFES